MAWLGLKVMPKKANFSQEKASTEKEEETEKMEIAEEKMKWEAEKVNGEAESKEGSNPDRTNQLEAMDVGGGETVSLPSGERSSFFTHIWTYI